MMYQTNYDNFERIIYYSLKDFNADTTHDRGFEWFYIYSDSLISTGKIEMQTIFVDDVMEKKISFQISQRIRQQKQKNKGNKRKPIK